MVMHKIKSGITKSSKIADTKLCTCIALHTLLVTGPDKLI
ncbi:MAG: hypothetical protein ACI90V_001981 [Bacillariaceae sp.]|jgi:hypothetical protein